MLNLDRCIWPHSSHRLTCVPCLSSEPRPRTMDSTDGRELDKPRSPRNLYMQHRHLDPPKTILDVDYKLLQSGVTILPGKDMYHFQGEISSSRTDKVGI